MNIELIKNHKAEFDHWLNGGKLLYCSNSSNVWYAVIGDDIWSIYSSDLKIVIDDEYVQFRIALAEDKTVEVLHYTGYKEFDQNHWKLFAIGISTFDKPVENYRIKPEEPQFKVGDWVRDSRDNNLKQVINPNSPAALSDYIKWKPQPGEWCWFYDNNNNLGRKTNTVIAKFSHMYQSMYASSHLIDSGYFYNCEPFIGTLPTHLQQSE